MYMDFKENAFMYILAFVVIGFVVAESVFFIVKAWKRAKELGIKKETLTQTVTSSALFTIAPAIAIFATVIILASSLGIVLPWIRLSVVGNLAYETVAAQTALDALGGSIATEITDPVQFAVAWVMTIGVAFGIFLAPFLCKKILNKVGKAVHKNEKASRMGDIISAAAFIGIIAAFIAREINGKSPANSEIVDNAGFLSIATLVTSVILTLVLETLAKKFNWSKFEPFIMPIAMFGAMGMAVLLTKTLPADIVQWTWWS